MLKRGISFFLFLIILMVATLSYAVDINLINVDMSPEDNNRLANAYGQAYGYTPQQVMPAMYGPPQEVPAIMQIAQAAGQVPMTVWMMRRMGMGYGSILSTFALAPSVLAGGPMGAPYGYPQPYYSTSPNWGQWTNPFYVQVARVNFLRNTLGVPVALLPYVPVRGLPFARSILYPYYPGRGYWMPPGIAKKYGLWIPPGQAKKMGWGPWGWNDGHWDWKGDKHGWKGGRDWDHDWKGHDGDWDKHSWKGDDDHSGKSKGGSGHGDNDSVGKGGGKKDSGQGLAQGNGSSKKGKGGSQGGGSSKGSGGGNGGGGKGKGKK